MSEPKNVGSNASRMKIKRLGPPFMKGFYDIAEDTIYLNSYLVEQEDPKIATEAVLHLSRYRQQILEILEYLKKVEIEPNLANDPGYEKTRLLMKNIDDYIYPWKEEPIMNNDEGLFWISTDGLKTNDKKIDWLKVREVVKP